MTERPRAPLSAPTEQPHPETHKIPQNAPQDAREAQSYRTELHAWGTLYTSKDNKRVAEMSYHVGRKSWYVELLMRQNSTEEEIGQWNRHDEWFAKTEAEVVDRAIAFVRTPISVSDTPQTTAAGDW